MRICMFVHGAGMWPCNGLSSFFFIANNDLHQADLVKWLSVFPTTLHAK